MVSKRRPPIHATNLNFRPVFTNNHTEPAKGTKPTSGPTSVKEIFTLMIIYLCKKSLFFDTNLKVAIYLGSLFLVSLVADFAPFPRTYLSRSDNVFNRFFVKFAWGWNLALVVPFVAFTSLIYCCGNRRQMLRDHAVRIAIATFFWWFWTSSFNLIEASLGRCGASAFATKSECLREGHVWHGLDLSGHCFILIYGSLFAIEECRCIANWDRIKEYIRLEEHSRTEGSGAVTTNPLRNLTDGQFGHVKRHYEKLTPYIRALFILIAVFQLLWDVMLICTMLYYHVMIEKFLGGVAAILTWFVTYRLWYRHPKCPPKLPGEGTFRYMKGSTAAHTPTPTKKRRESLTEQGPLFMGRPIYAKAKVDEATSTR